MAKLSWYKSRRSVVGCLANYLVKPTKSEGEQLDVVYVWDMVNVQQTLKR